MGTLVCTAAAEEDAQHVVTLAEMTAALASIWPTVSVDPSGIAEIGQRQWRVPVPSEVMQYATETESDYWTNRATVGEFNILLTFARVQPE